MTDPDRPAEQGPSFEKPAAPPPQQPSPQQPPGQQQYPPPPAQYPAAPPPAPGGYPGVDLGLPPGVELASVGRRIGAYFLAIPLWIVTLVIGYIIWGIIAWTRGTTPALQVLGMRCWTVRDRKVPGFWRMALREIIGRIVDGILSIITELISLIMFITGEHRQSLHDKVAGTTVVHDPQKVLG